MLKYLLYALIAFVAYYFIHKMIRHNKHMNFFLDMGFGREFMNKFSEDELFTAYDYVNNYSRKGITLTPSNNPFLYAKAKAVDNKFHIFYKLV